MAGEEAARKCLGETEEAPSLKAAGRRCSAAVGEAPSSRVAAAGHKCLEEAVVARQKAWWAPRASCRSLAAVAARST